MYFELPPGVPFADMDYFQTHHVIPKLERLLNRDPGK